LDKVKSSGKLSEDEFKNLEEQTKNSIKSGKTLKEVQDDITNTTKKYTGANQDLVDSLDNTVKTSKESGKAYNEASIAAQNSADAQGDFNKAVEKKPEIGAYLTDFTQNAASAAMAVSMLYSSLSTLFDDEFSFEELITGIPMVLMSVGMIFPVV
jgi:hypothetical protein